MLLPCRHLPLLGEGLGDEDDEEEDEEDVAGQGDVEHAQDGAGRFDDVTCDDGTQGDAGEESAVEVAESDVALGRRCAVGGVGVREGHGGDEGAAQAVDGVSHDDPVHAEGVRIRADHDGEHLADEGAGGAGSDDHLAPVAIREGAQFRGHDGGEDAGDEVGDEGELGDGGLDFGVATLRVLAPAHDGQKVVVGTADRLLGQVVPADEFEYQVKLWHDDAAEGGVKRRKGGSIQNICTREARSVQRSRLFPRTQTHRRPLPPRKPLEIGLPRPSEGLIRLCVVCGISTRLSFAIASQQWRAFVLVGFAAAQHFPSHRRRFFFSVRVLPLPPPSIVSRSKVRFYVGLGRKDGLVLHFLVQLQTPFLIFTLGA